MVNKKVPSLNPLGQGAFLWWLPTFYPKILSKYSHFLPQSKNMHVCMDVFLCWPCIEAVTHPGCDPHKWTVVRRWMDRYMQIVTRLKTESWTSKACRYAQTCSVNDSFSFLSAFQVTNSKRDALLLCVFFPPETRKTADLSAWWDEEKRCTAHCWMCISKLKHCRR